MAMVLVLCVCLGCDRYQRQGVQAPDSLHSEILDPAQITAEHPHTASSLGGVITSFGRDQFHAEAIVDEKGVLAIYLLGEDDSRLHPSDQQTFTAYIKRRHTLESAAIRMQAAPLPNDPVNMTSRFTGTLPDRMRGGAIYVVVPGIVLDGQRYMLRFELLDEPVPDMPAPVPSETAQALYLVAGGLYTIEDIKANGHQTASDKYRGFRPAHDPNPSPGDPICPITQTKANTGCSWIIGGEAYYFCCPPCIDEFLALAKSQPTQIRPPHAYRR